MDNGAGRCSLGCGVVLGSSWTLASHLRFAGFRGHWKVEIQDFSSRQAAAFEVVPTPNHFRGDAKIFGNRLHRIAFAYLVMRGDMGVSAGVALFARGDRNDETGFGRKRIVVQVVRFGDVFRSRTIGASYGSQRVSGVYFVISPPHAFVGWDGGDCRLKLVGSSRGRVQIA